MLPAGKQRRRLVTNFGRRTTKSGRRQPWIFRPQKVGGRVLMEEARAVIQFQVVLQYPPLHHEPINLLWVMSRGTCGVPSHDTQIPFVPRPT